MDVKVEGVPINILTEALEHARIARLHILETIAAELPKARADISPRAPRITSLQILPEQIGLVIGSGGKTINRIKEDTGVEEITIADDGSVFITGTKDCATKAVGIIQSLTKVFVVGEELEVTIVKVTSFGAFAKLDDQHEGLIHVSEIAPFRIEKTSDVLTTGEVVRVAVSKVENQKIGLSIKAIDPEFAVRKGVSAPQ